ncbi:hypothetical protein VE03_10264 [Pseudogymnoascus sp. 23342-1-I1]|nr:hypothetical protein VE03_10264 [Pseudogymnoascus sp. 23342-1-I1]
MASTSSSSKVEHFQFISIQSPHDAKNKTTRHLAQSHAVKRALRIKRMLQQDSGDNFRVTTSEDHCNARRLACTGTLDTSFCSGLDPFQTLPVDSSRLQILLGNYKARQASEPVFSVAKELAFQNFFAVFRTGLVDPALLNAVMLSLVFSATGGSIDHECLGYQGQAITNIRMKMSSLDEATSESTIGAILLLAGVESHVSSQLLREIQLAIDDPIWDDHPDLLLWLLYIGGTFSPEGTVRSNFVLLLRSNNSARLGDLNMSWPEVLEILKQFIWSEKAFTSQGKALWEEAFVQRIRYTKNGSIDY